MLFHPVCDLPFPAQTMERVFGAKCRRTEDYPAETDLQRRLKAYLLAGGQPGMGVGYRAITAMGGNDEYFTKESDRAALAEEQQRAAGGKLKFNKKPDNAMRDYQRALSKIQSKLPACVCKTFHGSVITDVAA